MAESREKAKAMIMSGVVFVDGKRADKPGTQYPPDITLTISGDTLRYVSRGGLKLEKAICDFHIKLEGVIAADIGASTGGFTDCMLQNGARKVYAIDVGYGQLAWKLRTDERVVVLERTNIRTMPVETITEPLDFVSIDVSFISLRLVLPKAFELLRDGGEAVVLIKPQFEAGREKVGKKGVVRDPKIHAEVIETVLSAAGSLGFAVKGLGFSPVKGPEGNIEYLAWLKKTDAPPDIFDIDALVARSHAELNGGT